MPRRKVLVDRVRELGEPSQVLGATKVEAAPGQLAVTFGRGRIAVLDLTEHRAAVWAEVLDSLRESGEPAYVEIDPETQHITELLLPAPYTVEYLERSREGFEVGLVISHAKHFVRRSNPEFEEIIHLLRRAQDERFRVLVTETLDTHEIVNVQPLDAFEEGSR